LEERDQQQEIAMDFPTMRMLVGDTTKKIDVKVMAREFSEDKTFPE
jgi:hypothetical protein